MLFYELNLIKRAAESLLFHETDTDSERWKIYGMLWYGIYKIWENNYY